MADRREQILSRLLVVAQGVPGIVSAFRNKDEISDKARRPWLLKLRQAL